MGGHSDSLTDPNGVMVQLGRKINKAWD